MEKNKVVAELVMTRKDGTVLVVQVQADAGFRDFYRFYIRVDELLRCENRGFNRPRIVHIEEIPEIMDRRAATDGLRIDSWKVTYPDRAGYERLLATPPEELGQGLLRESHWDPRRFPWLDKELHIDRLRERKWRERQHKRIFE